MVSELEDYDATEIETSRKLARYVAKELQASASEMVSDHDIKSLIGMAVPVIFPNWQKDYGSNGAVNITADFIRLEIESRFNFVRLWLIEQGCLLFVSAGFYTVSTKVIEAPAATPAPEAPPKAEPVQPDFERNVKRLEISKHNLRVIEIADRQDWDADRKMREICREDTSFAGLESPDWATLLNVTEGRIRQCAFWKKLQERKKRSD